MPDRLAARNLLASYIVDKKIPIPLSRFEKKDKVRKMFNNLYTATSDGWSTADECKTATISWKTNDYQFAIGPLLGATSLGHYGNDISNAFQISNRHNCGGYDRLSPSAVWFNKQLLSKMLNSIWSFSSRSPNASLSLSGYRAAFRNSASAYTAAQFKVAAARELFTHIGASPVTSILDFSCGWGDRLAGVYVTKSCIRYVGTDPNKDTWNTYMEQCRTYDYWRFLSVFGEIHRSRYEKPEIVVNETHFVVTPKYAGGVHVTIYCLPAEDINWLACYRDQPLADLVFTSCPYFSTERYAQGTAHENLQSWRRYTTANDWHEKFLFATMRNVTACVRSGGQIAINIMDATVHKIRVRTCDALFEFMKRQEDVVYKGYIALRMKQAPTSRSATEEKKKKHWETWRAEPIFVWEKRVYNL